MLVPTARTPAGQAVIVQVMPPARRPGAGSPQTLTRHAPSALDLRWGVRSSGTSCPSTSPASPLRVFAPFSSQPLSTSPPCSQHIPCNTGHFHWAFCALQPGSVLGHLGVLSSPAASATWWAARYLQNRTGFKRLSGTQGTLGAQGYSRKTVTSSRTQKHSEGKPF